MQILYFEYCQWLVAPSLAQSLGPHSDRRFVAALARLKLRSRSTELCRTLEVVLLHTYILASFTPSLGADNLDPPPANSQIRVHRFVCTNSDSTRPRKSFPRVGDVGS